MTKSKIDIMTLPHNYSSCFRKLEPSKTNVLEDSLSKAHSKVYIKAREEGVFCAKPDGELIPIRNGQKKCDYLIYSCNRPQLCFIELKGNNVSQACRQIIDSINYLSNDAGLRTLFSNDPELHAFVVSWEKQRIPKDIDSATRQLWKKIKNQENFHYVKVLPNAKYSDDKGRIICSSNYPILIPYEKCLSE